MTARRPSWWELLDLDWEAELILIESDWARELRWIEREDTEMIIVCPWCKKTIDTEETGGPGEHISSCDKMPPPAGGK